MFEFAWWWLLFALPLPIVVRLLPTNSNQTGIALRVPIISNAITTEQQTKQVHQTRLILASLVWILLVIAAARPQWLGDPISIPTQARDLMLAVDLSGSMKTEDMQVNGRQVDRLQMIKSVMLDFIQRRTGDRLGLILFADTAYLQAPLTYDRETVSQLLDESVIGLIGEQTAIGDAIGLAVKRFRQKDQSNRVLIILTDGQNTAGNITPQQALLLAKQEQVTLYTIGVGADQMMVRSFFGNRRVNPSQDLDEDLLTNLAASTGGMYFRARDAEALQAIYAKLDELEPISRDSQQMRPLRAWFYYPLGLALLLSVLMALWPLMNTWLNSKNQVKT